MGKHSIGASKWGCYFCNSPISYNYGTEITEAEYERIEPYLPVQHGNVKLSNLQALNEVLYVAEYGCRWRGLPQDAGPPQGPSQ